MILNRLSNDNLIEEIPPNMTFRVQNPFVLFKKTPGELAISRRCSGTTVNVSNWVSLIRVELFPPLWSGSGFLGIFSFFFLFIPFSGNILGLCFQEESSCQETGDLLNRYILYRGKLLREKSFANFAVLCLSAKVFSVIV